MVNRPQENLILTLVVDYLSGYDLVSYQIQVKKPSAGLT